MSRGLEELDYSCFPLTSLGIRLLASGIAAREGDNKGANHMYVGGVPHAGRGMDAAFTSSGPSLGQGGSVPAAGAEAASSSSVTSRAATTTPPPRTPPRQIRRATFPVTTQDTDLGAQRHWRPRRQRFRGPLGGRIGQDVAITESDFGCDRSSRPRPFGTRISALLCSSTFKPRER